MYVVARKFLKSKDKDNIDAQVVRALLYLASHKIGLPSGFEPPPEGSERTIFHMHNLSTHPTDIIT